VPSVVVIFLYVAQLISWFAYAFFCAHVVCRLSHASRQASTVCECTLLLTSNVIIWQCLCQTALIWNGIDVKFSYKITMFRRCFACVVW